MWRMFILKNGGKKISSSLVVFLRFVPSLVRKRKGNLVCMFIVKLPARRSVRARLYINEICRFLRLPTLSSAGKSVF